MKQDTKALRLNETTIGFITQYFGLDFIVLRGAGHMAASSKSKEFLAILNKFVKGIDLN